MNSLKVVFGCALSVVSVPPLLVFERPLLVRVSFFPVPAPFFPVPAPPLSVFVALPPVGRELCSPAGCRYPSASCVVDKPGRSVRIDKFR
jgi:hypothetical protein